MSLPRFRLRTLMIAVAVVAVILGLVLHVQALIRAEDDFAVPILMLEAIAVAVAVAVALAVGYTIRVVHTDGAYAAYLRRRYASARYPWLSVPPDPPEPK